MAQKKHCSERNLLDGNLFAAMVRFAIPVLFSSIFQQLYNTMDTVIVGHTLGETSLAAIGAATPVYDLLIGFALGIGNGLSIVTARSYGSGDRILLKRSVAASITIGIVISLVLTALACVSLLPFLKLLNTPAEILQEAYEYCFIIVLFTCVMFAYNLCSGILRAIGNSLMPLIFLIVSSVLNIFLDFLLISAVGMGVKGAAVATVFSQGVSVILCILYIYRKAKLLIPERSHFAADWELYQEMTTQGLSMGVMHCLVSAGSAVLQAGINDLGYLVIAGHTTARKLYQFGAMPFSAMIAAVSTFVSQNYGANRVDRIRKVMKYSYLYNATVTVIITVFIALLAPYMVKIISGSSEQIVIQNGTMYLRVVAPAYFVLGLVNNTRTALQAIGRKILPILSSIIELIGKILFVAFFIPKFQYNAVIFCEPIIWCFMALELLIAFWGSSYIRTKSP